MGDLNAWNPLALARNFQTLERRLREKTRPDDAHKQEKVEEGHEISTIEQFQEISENYQRKNPQLQGRTLLSLQARISLQDTVEEVLRKLWEIYSDRALADKVLDFLIQIAGPEMHKLLEKTKAELGRLNERDIKAGRNMGAQARNFSSHGLGSPTALQDLYRNIISNPRDANTLFQELSSNYPFEKMKFVIDFVLHSLGAEVVT